MSTNPSKSSIIPFFSFVATLNFLIRSDDLESKVDELTHRLENQTAEVLRLTMELEEYEYKDFGTANNSHLQRDEEDGVEGEEESDYEYVDDGKEPW